MKWQSNLYQKSSKPKYRNSFPRVYEFMGWELGNGISTAKNLNNFIIKEEHTQFLQ